MAYHSAPHGHSIAAASRTVSAARSARGALVYPVTTGPRIIPAATPVPLRLLRRRDQAHRHAPGRRAQRGAALRRRPVVLQLLHASHPADAAVQRPSHRAPMTSVAPRRRRGHRWWPATRCCRLLPEHAGRRADPPAQPTPTRPWWSSWAVRITMCGNGVRLLGDAFTWSGRHRRPTGITGRRRRTRPALPYFSLAMLPGRRRRALWQSTVTVVQGPGNDWMTPQSRRAGRAAGDLIGYRLATWTRSGVRRPAGAIPATTPTNPPGRGWPARWPIRVGGGGGVSGDPGYSRWPPPF